MKEKPMKRWTFVSLVCASGLALGGCVPNEASVEILATVAPDGCSAAPGNEPVSAAPLDVGVPGASLLWPFAVRNNLAANNDDSAERLNTRDIILERADITYSAVESDLQPFLEGIGQRSTPLGEVLEAQGDAAIWVNVVPRDVANALASRPELSNPDTVVTILATVRIHGRQQSGQPIDSSTLEYPIETCNGCSIAACGSDTPQWICSVGTWNGKCGSAP
jgi:hypothetical protein